MKLTLGMVIIGAVTCIGCVGMVTGHNGVLLGRIIDILVGLSVGVGAEIVEQRRGE